MTLIVETVRDVMTDAPVTVPPDAPLHEVARLMRDHDIGDVLVVDDTGLRGLLTDRDLVVRGLAEARDADTTSVAEVCTRNVTTVGPDDPIDQAVAAMRSQACRRLPVVAGHEVVGVVSLGDLAMHRDPSSALADISAADPNG